ILGECPGHKLTDEENKRMNAHLTEDYNDGIFVGYRYYEKYNVPVQFCFGHGLSYTDFIYKNAKAVWSTNDCSERCLVVSVDIINAGNYDGKETVQIYLGETHVSEENTVKELKGFDKVSLNAGEAKRIEISVAEKAFYHYDSVDMCWQPVHGRYNVYIASSAQDVRATLEIEY
ncbi:MAG: fibronectin type III-like domain-contianing protein, partial [Wujia sp.]